MERNENRFEEQEAPLKNTDNAFVKVGEDGKPEMPVEGKEAPQQQEKEQQKETERNL